MVQYYFGIKMRDLFEKIQKINLTNNFIKHSIFNLYTKKIHNNIMFLIDNNYRNKYNFLIKMKCLIKFMRFGNILKVLHPIYRVEMFN